MAQSWFIWKGEDCRSKGVRLQGPVPIVRPEERVEHVTIPGRAGELTLLEGDDIYNSYIQTATILVPGWYRVSEIYRWLRGSGYVTFHGEPNRRQKARVIGAMTLQRHAYNLDWWTGEVQFYCEPLKEALKDDSLTVAINGTVYNRGDVTCRPMITVQATATTMAISAGGNTLTVTGATSGRTYYIDCDSRIIWHGTSTITVDTQLTSGDFPQLVAGSNTVGGSGWSSMTMVRRERYL